MAKLAREGSRNIDVRSVAVEQTRRLLQKDYEGEARLCLAFVRDQIRYVRDIRGVETVHAAEYVLHMGAGDCDDKSILLAAMLGSIGHRCRFVAVAFAPERFSHVWVQCNIRGRWVDLEPTEPIAYGKRIPSRGAVEHIYQEV